MNLLLLLAGFQPWRTSSSLARLTRVFAAISVFSVEMQIVTWLDIGSIRTLPAVNIVLAILALVAWRPERSPQPAGAVRFLDAVPLAATLSLGALVLALNLGLPLKAADPYHLEKVERIERLGTLAYDQHTERKINVLSSVYEMLLADLRLIPIVGPLIVRLHGVWGLLLYLVAVGAVRELLVSPGAGGVPADPSPHLDARLKPRATIRTASHWPWVVMLVVPALFHQLVLIKNDLFIAVPAVVTLVWIVTRSKTASWPEVVWASWLAGFAVAVKLTTLPLLLVLGGAILLQRWRDWKAVAGAALGTLIGMVAGGLAFTLAENERVYGQLMPVADQESLNAGLMTVSVGLSRFAISLVDLGLVTRIWWPGRGGWGGTFGLPLLWACAVLARSSRRFPMARRALICAAVYFLTFGATFPDADLAHRLALGPALLLVSVAVSGLEQGYGSRTWRLALIPVTVLSGAQIARSAVFYLMR